MFLFRLLPLLFTLLMLLLTLVEYLDLDLDLNLEHLELAMLLVLLLVVLATTAFRPCTNNGVGQCTTYLYPWRVRFCRTNR